MNENCKKIMTLQAQNTITHLREHNFAADYFETKEDVLNFLKENIKKGASVGIGGSMTLNEAGITPWLTGNEDYVFYDRYHTDDVKKVFHQSLSADVYITSSNAVTEDGGLYNVDGNGNRVAALIYGPEKVYVVAGINKLVRDLDEAIERVQMLTAPANNVRLNIENPCTKAGRCIECNAPTSICNQFVYTRRSGTKDRIHVLLVGEELGY